MPTPAELADQLVAGAAALRKAVAGMTREQLTARPVPGKWSTMEVVAHIADFDPVLVDRMKRIVALGDVPLLLVADENLYLKAFNYHERDVEDELALIELTRKQAAKPSVDGIASAIQQFNLDAKRLPTQEEGLQALVVQPNDVTDWNGPYIPASKLKDPWGRDFVYKNPGVKNPTGFDVYSMGPKGDVNQGEDDDIGNW